LLLFLKIKDLFSEILGKHSSIDRLGWRVLVVSEDFNRVVSELRKFLDYVRDCKSGVKSDCSFSLRNGEKSFLSIESLGDSVGECLLVFFGDNLINSYSTPSNLSA
jgi:hypothetical protein